MVAFTFLLDFSSHHYLFIFTHNRNISYHQNVAQASKYDECLPLHTFYSALLRCRSFFSFKYNKLSRIVVHRHRAIFNGTKWKMVMIRRCQAKQLNFSLGFVYIFKWIISSCDEIHYGSHLHNNQNYRMRSGCRRRLNKRQDLQEINNFMPPLFYFVKICHIILYLLYAQSLASESRDIAYYEKNGKKSFTRK